MYKSPINIYETADTMRTYIINKQNEDIYHAVLSYGISVDKGELLRALRYDRGQYEKGYADGKDDATPKWIPVTERLPEKSDWYMAVTYTNSVMVLPFSAKNKAFNSFDSDCVKDNAIECSHWMPLPSTPEGE